MVGTLCTAGFIGSIIFAALFTDTYDDNDEVGLNMWYLLSMLVGVVAGSYGLVGFTVWLVVILPLVEMAWLMFSFGLYCLGYIMGLFK